MKRLIEELEKNDYEDSIINLDSWTSFGYKYFIENYYKELRNKSLNPFLKLWDSSFKTLINELDNNIKFDKIPSIFGYALLPIIYSVLTYFNPQILSFFSRFEINIASDSPSANVLVIVFSFLIFIFLKAALNYFFQQKSYNEIKKDIQKKISENFEGNPLVVIIDDLDRSDSEDIKQILKLVKSDANFANVIYILSYDRTSIEKKISRDEADFFFDKIVQLPIGIKTPSQSALQSYFSKKIGDKLVEIKYPNEKSKKLQNQYFNDLFFLGNGLFQLFTNLRMVDKFLLSFEEELKNQKKYIGHDICLGDLAFIEFIRIFDYNIFNGFKHDKFTWTNRLTVEPLEKNKFFGDTKTTFWGDKLVNYFDVFKFIFKRSVQSSPPEYRSLNGKISDKPPIGVDFPNWGNYFNLTLVSETSKTLISETSGIIYSNNINNDLQEFFITKDVRDFYFKLISYKNKGNDVSNLILPSLLVGDTFKDGILGERSHILTFLKNYYENNSEAKPDFIDLVESDSVATLAYFLARYKIDSKDSQVTNMYKLSPDEWGKVGDKIHARFKNKWSQILLLENEDFVTTLEVWKELISPTQFVELQQIIEDEFTILNKGDSSYFNKNKFIKMLEKFGRSNTIFNLDGKVKRKTNFGFHSYVRLSKFVDLEKVKEKIEKHDLYSEAEICKDFIDGWDNREVDPFKKGWN